MRGEKSGRSAAAARAAALTVAARTAFHAHLGDELGQARLHRGVARALEANHHVVGRLLPVGLAPSVGKEVLQAGGGGLPQLVRPGDADVHALVEDFLVVRHGRPSVAGRLPAPGVGYTEGTAHRR